MGLELVGRTGPDMAQQPGLGFSLAWHRRPDLENEASLHGRGGTEVAVIQTRALPWPGSRKAGGRGDTHGVQS